MVRMKLLGSVYFVLAGEERPSNILNRSLVLHSQVIPECVSSSAISLVCVCGEYTRQRVQPLARFLGKRRKI